MITVALSLESAAAVKIGNGVKRIDLDRFIVVCDRVVTIAVNLVHAAAANVRLSVLRINLDCLGEIFDRAVAIALRLVGTPADRLGDRAVGCRLTWSLNDLRAGGDGGVPVTGLIALIPYAFIDSGSRNCRENEQQSRRNRHGMSHHASLSQDKPRCSCARGPIIDPPKASEINKVIYAW